MVQRLTAESLDAAYTGFSLAFTEGFSAGGSTWGKVAMEVPSSTSRNAYVWLGDMPLMKKWLGERVVHGVGGHQYTIDNEDYELTVSVSRNDLEDDQSGVYRPLFENMGEAASRLGDDLVWKLMKGGFSGKCYDGKAFFATDHPVLNEKGGSATESNSGGGNGTPWYLIDGSRRMKPLIFQRRSEARLTRKDAASDEKAFWGREFVYGVEARAAAGYGLWQLAYGSKQTLNETNFNTAMEKFMGMKGDYGRPLNVRPTLLAVPPSLRSEAAALVLGDRKSNGASNTNYGVVELHVEPRLSLVRSI